jgi:signal recognition particle subunit SRP19
MRKLKNRFVIWPQYLDASKSEREGRRVPKRVAVNSPSIQEICDATKILKLNPELKMDLRYPRTWWEKSGYLIIDRGGSKNQILKILAGKISTLRSQKKDN